MHDLQIILPKELNGFEYLEKRFHLFDDAELETDEEEIEYENEEDILQKGIVTCLAVTKQDLGAIEFEKNPMTDIGFQITGSSDYIKDTYRIEPDIYRIRWQHDDALKWALKVVANRHDVLICDFTDKFHVGIEFISR